jgi:hypothetical protein
MKIAGGLIGVNFQQAEMSGVFLILIDIKSKNTGFFEGCAGIFQNGRFVSLDKFGLNIMVELKNQHAASLGLADPKIRSEGVSFHYN